MIKTNTIPRKWEYIAEQLRVGGAQKLSEMATELDQEVVVAYGTEHTYSWANDFKSGVVGGRSLRLIINSSDYCTPCEIVKRNCNDCDDCKLSNHACKLFYKISTKVKN